MRKIQSAIEWSRDDYRTLRFAPGINAEEHIKEFAVFGLAQALGDFGVGSFEGTGVVEWYWKQSRSWPRKETQNEFNKFARARISDYVGNTRRRGDAFHVVGSLFDRARFLGTTFDEIVDAVAFLAKSEPIPPEKIVETTALIDLTRRKDSPKLLKVDLTFLPVLRKLYPVERIDDVIVKHIPVGETSTREFNLVKLAWWSQTPDTSLDEMNRALRFADGDRMNWTKANLYSKWREAAARYANAGVPEELPESPRDANGDVRMPEGRYVELPVGIGEVLANSGPQAIEPPAKATMLAAIQSGSGSLNWLRGVTDKDEKINRAKHP